MDAEGEFRGFHSEPKTTYTDSKVEHPALDSDSSKIIIINIPIHNLLLLLSNVADVKSDLKNFLNIFRKQKKYLKITLKLMVCMESKLIFFILFLFFFINTNTSDIIQFLVKK